MPIDCQSHTPQTKLELIASKLFFSVSFGAAMNKDKDVFRASCNCFAVQLLDHARLNELLST